MSVASRWRRGVLARGAVVRGRSRLAGIVGATCLVLSLAACGQRQENRAQVFPAAGQVLLNGRPLAGALVVFHPQGSTDVNALPARAQTDAEGRFQASTYDAADGAIAGFHTITVEQYVLRREGDSLTPGPNVLPRQYASPQTSDLRVWVAEGKNSLPPLLLRK